MTGFPEGHDRIAALEWLIQQLAVEHCLRTRNPMATADKIMRAARDYGDELVAAAAKDNEPDHLMTAIEVSGAVQSLVEFIPSDVESALK